MMRMCFVAGLLLAFLLLPYQSLHAEVQPSAQPDKGTVIADENLITLKAPFTDKRFSAFPLAVVNDHPITLAAFRKALSSSGEKTTLTGKEMAAQLDRMITLELILEEARSMGIDELKDVQMQVESYSRDVLLEVFQAGKIKDVKVDEAEVEKRYQDMVREYLTESALFDKEDDARKMITGLAEGKSFGELADAASKDGLAKIDRSNTYLKESSMIIPIRKAVAEMKAGAVSPLITIDTDKGQRFVVLRLIDIRYPEDDAIREQARQSVLKKRQMEAIEKYNTEVYNKYLTIDYKLLDKIDFEAKKPGFEKMLQDKRVLVKIKGDKPVTVGDLAEALKWRFFHGPEDAAERKRLNKQKFPVLRDIIGKRLFKFLALKEGVDKSAEYQEKVADYKESLVIGKFIEKVVAPEIKADEQTLKDYYTQHIADFSYPEMVKMESLAFASKGDAEAVLDSLNKGTDFTWSKQNAEGIVDAKTKGVLTFSGNLIMTSQMSEDVKKAIAGAHAGDYRLYAGPGGYYYVLSVVEVVPATAKPYEEVRAELAEKVARELVGEGITNWGKKLREVYPVTIYARFDD